MIPTEVTTARQLLKEYNELTEINDHNGAANLLIERYGSHEERAEMASIIERSEHSVSQEDERRRRQISNKYYKLLKQIAA